MVVAAVMVTATMTGCRLAAGCGVRRRFPRGKHALALYCQNNVSCI